MVEEEVPGNHEGGSTTGRALVVSRYRRCCCCCVDLSAGFGNLQDDGLGELGGSGIPQGVPEGAMAIGRSSGAVSSSTLAFAHIRSLSYAGAKHRSFQQWRLGSPKRGWPPRDVSLRKARGLRERLSQDPSSFESLARAHSDDPTTAMLGGLLGGKTAIDLVLWPQVLDTAAALRPGQISDVIESPLGFHILKMHRPPAKEEVAGRRIVIGYVGADWLQVVERPGRPRRSYEDAMRLAAELRRRLERPNADFPALVQEFSDHQDVALGGDVGVWSTHEPTVLSLEIQALSRLAVGEISAPIDTFLGYVILQRTPTTERQSLPVRVARFRFDDPTSEAEALALAHRALSLFQESGKSQRPSLDPSPFIEEIWGIGRIDVPLYLASIELSPKECVSEPLRLNYGYAIFCLSSSERGDRPPSLLTLPAPRGPDLRILLPRASPSTTRDLVELMQREGLRKGEASQSSLAEAARMHRQLISTLSQVGSAAARLEQLDHFLGRLEELLGTGLFERYLDRVRVAVGDEILR